MIRIFKVVSNISRKDLIPYKNKDAYFDENKNNILFFINFNYNLDYKKIIINLMNESHINSNLKLIYINRISNNVNSLLVHNMKLLTVRGFSTTSCGSCNICNLIYNKSFIHIKDLNLKINLKSNGSCSSKNIIYIIVCDICNLFYIGETAKSLKERISQHIYHIRKFIPFVKFHEKEVGKHFNLNGHSISNFKVCIFKDEFNSEYIRKQVEKDLINVLNIARKRCLNKFICNNANSLCFS